MPETARRLTEKMQELMDKGLCGADSRVLLVDDGSKDKTWELIAALHAENPLFEGLKLSRNRGHQNALLAGLMTARKHCDVSISMDADLQDDMDAIDRFLAEYQNGCDVVYGVRNKRKTDSFFKRQTALFFYRFMKGLGVDIIYNHADYRLMSRRALDALAEFSEVNLFLRGIAPLIGFQTGTVYYDRTARFAGESKYPFKKMLAFAIDGITSFSVKPPQADYDAGYHHSDHLPVDACLHADLLDPGQDRHRLDEHSGFDLDDWRHPAVLPGRNRRIHRQNLQRNQAPPALYHRPVLERRQRRSRSGRVNIPVSTNSQKTATGETAAVFICIEAGIAG